LSDEPDDGGKKESEKDVEGGAGDEDQHARGVADRREFGDVSFAFALDGAQVGELREEHVAAERNPRETVFDAVLTVPRNDRRTEADGEALDVNAAAAGGEEVAELVDEDGAAEEENDEEESPGVGRERREEFGHCQERCFSAAVATRRAWASASRTAGSESGVKLSI